MYEISSVCLHLVIIENIRNMEMGSPFTILFMCWYIIEEKCHHCKYKQQGNGFYLHHTIHVLGT
jgi:hypothetical protein